MNTFNETIIFDSKHNVSKEQNLSGPNRNMRVIKMFYNNGLLP